MSDKGWAIRCTEHTSRDLAITYNGERVKGIRKIEIELRPDSFVFARMEVLVSTLDLSQIKDVELRKAIESAEIAGVGDESVNTPEATP